MTAEASTLSDGMNQRKRSVAANAPASWAAMNPATSPGRIPAKVLLIDRARVTAGLALTHERCEALRETVGLVSKDKCGHAEHKRDFAALVDALRLQKLREFPVRTENVLLDPDLNEKL